MMRLVLCLAFIVALAAPTYAQDVVGNGTNASSVARGGRLGGPHAPRDDEDRPTAPVPEPGTMALASMGLIAIGAAARKRRTR